MRERSNSFLLMKPDEQAFLSFFKLMVSEESLRQCREKIRRRKGEDKNKVAGFDRVTYAVPKRVTRSFDIYNGPKLIATVQDRGGYVITVRSAKKMSEWLVCSYLRLQSYDDSSDAELLQHLSYCEGFNSYVERLLDHGLDIAAATEPDTRTLLGRSWRIMKDDRVIGSLQDYPGQFSCNKWVPIAGELESKQYTMTMYIADNTKPFDICFNSFMKCKSITQLLSTLEKEYITLVPMLHL